MRDKALSTRVGPTYRLWEVKFGSYPFEGERAGTAGPQGRADLLDGRRGRHGCHRRPARRRARDADLGRGRRGARLVQARLDRGGSQAPCPGQRVQHARRDVGGTRRRDHAARRLRRPLLPGGLPGAGVPAAVPEADRRAGDGLRGGLRLAAGARGRQVRDEGRQLGQGRPAALQHLPADRPLPRGRLPARAVRRADDRPVPGRGDGPDPGRGGPPGRRASTRS